MIAAALLISLLRIDIDTGAVTERKWDHEAPIAVGSLAKPFIALAYGQRNEFRFPVVNCTGCWLPRGHGRLELRQALAHSCNMYFDTLRRKLPPGDLSFIARRFGMESLDGASPEALLRAYIELYARRSEPGVPLILEGMRLAAKEGTASGVNADVFAKTGTAPCTHTPREDGDGFVIVLSPAARPRTAILVRVCGRPGSAAARVCGRLLH